MTTPRGATRARSALAGSRLTGATAGSEPFFSHAITEPNKETRDLPKTTGATAFSDRGLRDMKRGFFTIMAAQFFSSLADQALFVAAVQLLRSGGAPAWQQAALVPMFALFYVLLAPFVGAFADALPKGRVMLISNTIKAVGCLLMLFGTHPLLSYAVVGLGLPPIRRPSTAS